ncbi:MFS family permease [Mycolicibacterium sp. BK556]|uniref:MFS transporter n=1 Tax=unclassified Mycolicibacterium TaxID=2636767 RepID=UPI00162028B4|nr:MULTISPECIES: MFS transporter [unclassified Mycolicibacterium]MBB3605724.1 MFS family permease [Mycolicibacterium sp. BK556]MBB3635779.1 MFS family permease [Mycolicibacterium sp. BK607]
MTRIRRDFAFALLAYAFAAIMVGTTLPTPLYALYSERMHFSVLTTTVIYATYAGGVLFALLVFGRWSDAIGRRPVLLAGTVCALASAVVFLIADSIPLLLVGRVLSGLSAGMFTGTATAAVIEAAPPSWRTRAPAVATIANIGGLGSGPILAGILAQYAPSPLTLTFVVHIALVVLAAIAVLLVQETSSRTGKIGLQRLSVPPEVRSVFIVAALAAFAGFTVTGLFTSVAPSMLTTLIGIGDHALAGVIAGSIFGASAIAQIFGTRIAPQRAVAIGCAILTAGMGILVVALHYSSLIGLIAAAVVSGIGQGISFSRGLAAVAELTPPERRAEVSSTYFVVAYIAISIPVIGEGFAAQAWGLRTGGIVFATAVGVLALACLGAILWQESRAKSGRSTYADAG